ncbi:PfkB family carbohydrate kinase [Deinococcus sp.]|uniref:PfkB family carbohydrate kinase n=1 Tax=Deinococcus sp. TaxID=47478 RepID=UPI00391DC8DA
MNDVLAVVGGVYRETCEFPIWDSVFGSAGRAAALLAHHHPLTLHSVTSPGFSERLAYLLRGTTHRATLKFTPAEQGVTFEYLHALGSPTYYPDPAPQRPRLTVEADNILKFGALEFDTVTRCRRLVYDPQNSHPEPHDAGGASADQVVYVLNHIQARSMTGQENLQDAAVTILENPAIRAVIIKRGVFGADLFEQGQPAVQIGSYPTDGVFKIGSGDVFSAAFALFWMINDLSLPQAARFASAATAQYVETRDVRITLEQLTARLSAVEPFYIPEEDIPSLGRVYVAAPFFNLSQRWLVEEIVTFFEKERIPYFSPFHDVGRGSQKSLGEQDLEALNNCRTVFGWVDDMDPGTLLELGYARRLGLNTYTYAYDVSQTHRMMFDALNCRNYGDLAAALYNAVWNR